ncbi:hypothetical protein HK098_003373 [Nowakowskiella sp. JEL0407]|nr:hypothetical protein HK098_003373 [Nowakowskiella sp. JEL0407]
MQDPPNPFIDSISESPPPSNALPMNSDDFLESENPEDFFYEALEDLELINSPPQHIPTNITPPPTTNAATSNAENSASLNVNVNSGVAAASSSGALMTEDFSDILERCKLKAALLKQREEETKVRMQQKSLEQRRMELTKRQLVFNLKRQMQQQQKDAPVQTPAISSSSPSEINPFKSYATTPSLSSARKIHKSTLNQTPLVIPQYLIQNFDSPNSNPATFSGIPPPPLLSWEHPFYQAAKNNIRLIPANLVPDLGPRSPFYPPGLVYARHLADPMRVKVAIPPQIMMPIPTVDVPTPVDTVDLATPIKKPKRKYVRKDKGLVVAKEPKKTGTGRGRGRPRKFPLLKQIMRENSVNPDDTSQQEGEDTAASAAAALMELANISTAPQVGVRESSQPTEPPPTSYLLNSSTSPVTERTDFNNLLRNRINSQPAASAKENAGEQEEGVGEETNTQNSGLANEEIEDASVWKTVKRSTIEMEETDPYENTTPEANEVFEQIFDVNRIYADSDRMSEQNQNLEDCRESEVFSVQLPGSAEKSAPESVAGKNVDSAINLVASSSTKNQVAIEQESVARDNLAPNIVPQVDDNVAEEPMMTINSNDQIEANPTPATSQSPEKTPKVRKRLGDLTIDGEFGLTKISNTQRSARARSRHGTEYIQTIILKSPPKPKSKDRRSKKLPTPVYDKRVDQPNEWANEMELPNQNIIAATSSAQPGQPEVTPTENNNLETQIIAMETFQDAGALEKDKDIPRRESEATLVYATHELQQANSAAVETNATGNEGQMKIVEKIGKKGRGRSPREPVILKISTKGVSKKSGSKVKSRQIKKKLQDGVNIIETVLENLEIPEEVQPTDQEIARNLNLNQTDAVENPMQTPPTNELQVQPQELVEETQDPQSSLTKQPLPHPEPSVETDATPKPMETQVDPAVDPQLTIQTQDPQSSSQQPATQPEPPADPYAFPIDTIEEQQEVEQPPTTQPTPKKSTLKKSTPKKPKSSIKGKEKVSNTVEEPYGNLEFTYDVEWGEDDPEQRVFYKSDVTTSVIELWASQQYRLKWSKIVILDKAHGKETDQAELVGVEETSEIPQPAKPKGKAGRPKKVVKEVEKIAGNPSSTKKRVTRNSSKAGTYTSQKAKKKKTNVRIAEEDSSTEVSSRSNIPSEDLGNQKKMFDDKFWDIRSAKSAKSAKTAKSALHSVICPTTIGDRSHCSDSEGDGDVEMKDYQQTLPRPQESSRTRREPEPRNLNTPFLDKLKASTSVPTSSSPNPLILPNYDELLRKQQAQFQEMLSKSQQMLMQSMFAQFSQFVSPMMMGMANGFSSGSQTLPNPSLPFPNMINPPTPHSPPTGYLQQATINAASFPSISDTSDHSYIADEEESDTCSESLSESSVSDNEDGWASGVVLGKLEYPMILPPGFPESQNRPDRRRESSKRKHQRRSKDSDSSEVDSYVVKTDKRAKRPK